jgi:hypothetical protein
MMFRLICSCLGICIVLAGAVSAETGDGGYAAPWLQVPIGARPAAMGGAYIGISDDGAGPLYNPAGVVRLKRPMFSSSYRVMTLDRTLGYVTAMSPVRGQATLGVHWLYSGSGKVQARDGDGYLLDHDMALNSHNIAIVFAKMMTSYLAVGANLDYILVDMAELGANSVGFDFGAMIYVEQLVDREKRESLPIRDLQIGLIARNFNKKFDFISDDYNAKYTTTSGGTEQKDNVPVELGLGISGRLLDRRLVLASDVRKVNHESAKLHAGAEYFLTQEFMLRAGYSDTRLTAGTGYLFKMGKNALSIDYAFSTDKADEGSEHIFSFDLLF